MLRRCLFVLVLAPLALWACEDVAPSDGDVDIPDYPGGPTLDGDADTPRPADGDEPDGDVTPDGDATDGDATPDGDDPVLPDGDAPDGDAPDGDVADGDVTPDGDQDPPLPPVYQSDAEPFEPGRLEVRRIAVAKGEEGAPVDFLVFAPEEPGDYAVVVFQHGFLMANSYYSKILTIVASHGFVVVAPQMYAAGGLPVGKPTAWNEALTASQFYTWLDTNLSRVSGVGAKTEYMGLAGHSRGGKVIWIVLSGDPTRAQAVAGVDPVDGQGGPLGGDMRVISTDPSFSFRFPFPSLVIGTGLGPTGLSPCAPNGDNHVQFYRASASPAIHQVATNFGHNDMMDEKNPENCGVTCTICASADIIVLMRTYTAGMLSSFFRWTLQGQTAMLDVLLDADAAPISVTLERK